MHDKISRRRRRKKRNTSEITDGNTVKTTRNGSTNIGEVIMPRIRN